MKNVNTTILIDGVESPVEASQVKIHSPYHTHHSFEVTVALSLADSVGISDIQAMLGEKITITIQAEAEPDQQGYFIGLVDEILPIWSPQGRFLIIKGFSPTILLDTATVFRTIRKERLDQVVRRLANGRNLSVGIQPTDKVIDWYLSNQTDFALLRSLANEHQKLFTYTGAQLYFGDLRREGAEEIQLQQETDLLSLCLSLNLCPLELRLSGYDPVTNQELPPARPGQVTSQNPLLSAIMAKSPYFQANLFQAERTTKRELDQRAARTQNRQSHKMVALHGQSGHPGIKVGSVITIDTEDDLLEGAFEGRFLIIQVDHQVTDHTYVNSWIGIPIEHPYPIPMEEGRRPLCGPRMAIVREITDTKHGLVGIQFIGDETRNISPGVPVVTAFTSDGGAYTLPQPGELVIVFFENFNPQKPLVVGSRFFGGKKADRWANGKRGFAIGDVVFEVDNEGGLIISAKTMKFLAEQLMEVRSAKIHLNPRG